MKQDNSAFHCFYKGNNIMELWRFIRWCTWNSWQISA